MFNSFVIINVNAKAMVNLTYFSKTEYVDIKITQINS